MTGPAPGAGPVLVPSDLLHVPAGVAGLGGGVPAVRYDEAGAVPSGLVGQLAAGLAEGGVGQAAPAGACARQALCRSIPAASKPSTTISPWVLASLVVRLWRWWLRMLAALRCSRVIFRWVSV